ncbi:hypothetical protein Tco_0917333 [Tanacetum coccineum]
MTLINKGFAEANSNQPPYGTLNDRRPHQVSGTRHSQIAKKGLKEDIATDHSKATIDKEESRRLTLRSHRDQTCSKIGDLLLGALEADLFQDVKPDIHKFTKKSNACKATSFSSSTTENNPKVHHHSVESLSNDSSKCTRSISSGTSPASHVHVAISESDFQSPLHTPCHNFGERKFPKQCPTRFSIGSIMPSRLRMPSPKIGFFDEVYMQFLFL